MLTSNQTLVQGFESIGFTPKVQALKEFEDDYGLKLDGDDEDDEDDDDDEEFETGSEDEMDEDEDE